MFCGQEAAAVYTFLTDRRHAVRTRRRLMDLLEDPANQARVEAWLARTTGEDPDLEERARYYLCFAKARRR